MESFETRLQHFQKHGKGDNTMQSLTFWGKNSELKTLTTLRFSRHFIYMDFMKINCEEQSIRQRKKLDLSEYDPTLWRIICSYEEIVKRIKITHSLVEILSAADPELRQLVTPVPEFAFNVSMWQEKIVSVMDDEMDEEPGKTSINPIKCGKTTQPLYDYICDGGELDRQIESMIFWFYRRDMEEYQKAIKNDGF